MQPSPEKHSGWLLIIGIIVGVLGLTAGPALAALTFSSTSITGDTGVVIDSPSTISIGTSTATGVTIGNGSSTTTLSGNVAIGTTIPAGVASSSFAVAGNVAFGNDASVDTDTPESFTGGPSALLLYNTFSGANADGGSQGINDTAIADPDQDGSFIYGQTTAGILKSGNTTSPAQIWGTYTTGIDYGSGALPLLVGAEGLADNESTAAVTQAVGVFGTVDQESTGSIAEGADFWAQSPSNGGGGSMPYFIDYYADDLGGLGITNPYFSWFDSQGVGRCKDDSSFNGVDQSICVVYNPLFTKYSPGATNFERIVYGEWNSNVAEMGTEAGGTGTLRPLDLMGSKVGISLAGVAPSTTLQVAGASSTILIGGSALPGCIEVGNSNGSAGINYVTFLNGVMTATTTKPSNCQ